MLVGAGNVVFIPLAPGGGTMADCRYIAYCLLYCAPKSSLGWSLFFNFKIYIV